MTRFNTKAELLEAYTHEAAYWYFARKESFDLGTFAEAKDFAGIGAPSKVKYHPHIYRGGYVIPGFGYSIERFELCGGAENAGDPCGVCA